MAITEAARIRQIIGFRCPTVFEANYMIDLAPKESVIFMDQAVLTKIIGTTCLQRPAVQRRFYV